MELTTKDWKEFRIGDLFDCYLGKSPDKQDITEIGNYSVISAQTNNNGIIGYTDCEDRDFIYDDKLTLGNRGSYKCFYQKGEFYAGNNVIVFDEKFTMNKFHKLFIATLINKLNFCGYTKYPTKTNIVKETLLLPFKNDEPDWDFMEEFIKGIEEKYILNVDKYNQENIDKALSVTGLTTADLNGNLEVKPADRYEEFRVGDLFDVSTIRGVNNESLNNDYSKGKYRYITRTSLNNGISSITGKIGSLEIQKSNTFSLGLLGMNFFFQTEPWYAGQFVRNISPKFEINRPLSLYFGTLFNKRSKSYQSVLIRDFDKIFKNEKILLPAIDENTPDFDYMEKAIYIYILKRSLSLGKWITKKKSEL